MFNRTLLAGAVKDPIWMRVGTLSITIFFIFLGDAILSFWVPGFVQDSFASPLLMGLILSFSSIVGLLADLILPQLLRGITVRKLLILGILTGVLFALLLIGATHKPLVLIFLTAMALWGIYYELLGFANQQFVADSIPMKFHSSSWAVLSTFKNLAYFLGPLIATWILLINIKMPPLVAVLFSLVGFLILVASGTRHDRPISIDTKEVSLMREITHWWALLKHVWPIVIMSTFMGLIDATFWTTGTVLTEKLSHANFSGGLFLSFYTLPALFMGFVVAKWNIYQGKKRLAQKLLIFAGLVLSGMVLFESIYWILLTVFVSSLLLSVAYPLVDAVYSDIVARMGRERRHMIGLTNSTFSLAYIIGPAVAGLITTLVGEKMTFVVMGGSLALVSSVLLMITPKKIKLPQKELGEWKD